jgi:small subunit ribosomal protein S15
MLLAAGQSLSRALPRAARLHAPAARRNAKAQAQPSSRPAAKRKTDTVRPSVVLGTRPHEEETLWNKCDLALCLVNRSVLNGPPPSTVYEEVEVPEFDTIHIPTDTSYGVGPVEKQMLFQELPRLTTQAPMHRADSPFTRVFNSQLPQITPEDMQDRDKKATKAEAAKVAAFSRVVDLRNANAKGIAYENRRRIILAFSGPKNPFDPGRAEVQGQSLFRFPPSLLSLTFLYLQLPF